MSEEGGHKCLFELWSGIDCLLICYFMKGMTTSPRQVRLSAAGSWKEGWVFCYGGIGQKNTVKRNAAVWRIRCAEKQKSGLFMQTHTHMHTHKHTLNLQEVRASALKARRANIVRCTPARTSKCIHTHCLFVYAWLFFTTIFHSSFVSSLVYANRA